MKSKFLIWPPFILLIGLFFLSNCKSEDNPVIDLNDPSTFPGNYSLVSVTDKTGNTFDDLGQAGLTLQAGQPTNITVTQGGSTVTVTATISGTLVLTDTRYTITTTIVATAVGLGSQTDTNTDTGTYSISGSTITIDSDDPNEPTQTGTITTSGRQFTLEDTDSRFVFEKQ